MNSSTVLIVLEDIIANVLKNFVEASGKDCTIATTFDEVEQLIAANNYQLVVTELSVDGIFTNEYIDFLHQKLPEAKLIVVTQMEHQNVKDDIEQLGIEEYITLPVDIRTLKDKIFKYV
ncbi:response regulator [Aquimarina brevivitae]|uniref:Response regulator receiver domain-containing protein n=1 Tax=Aquimarina brevivitae TaxID=323412 RepID=A0A4V2F7A2_9FLAO|nr:response regulator [Aquimarina brevivitae]RZS99109.1 response regulator receiver domain-containing protein [Aquimarina brevivitae]